MNEAEPTTRLRLHVSTAVQGELFPATGTQPVTRGYKVRWLQSSRHHLSST